MRSLWHDRKGWLEIEISGPAVERFLNLALQKQVQLTDIEYLSPQSARCRVALEDVRTLHPIARQSRCRIHIAKRIGLPFWWQRWRQRWPLLVGGIIFIVLFYLAGQVALEIEVTGPMPISAAQAADIREIVAQEGVTVGRLIGSMDFDEAAKQIKIQNDHITFAALSACGNKVTVQIVWRTEIPLDDQPLPPGNIVATCDAVIQDVLVTKGEAVVKSGDQVKTGDILILGYNDYGPQAAAGIVRAIVDYSGRGQCDLTEEGFKFSGRSQKQVQLWWQGEAQLIVWGSQEPDYELFSTSEQAIPLVIWRKFSLPVEVVTKDFREKVPYQISRTAEEARAKAQTMAEQAALRQLPPAATIVERIVTPGTEEGQEVATMTLRTVQDIASFSAYDVETHAEEYAKLQQEKKAARTGEEWE